jgi:uncharacterized protein YaaQ
LYSILIVLDKEKAQSGFLPIVLATKHTLVTVLSSSGEFMTSGVTTAMTLE